MGNIGLKPTDVEPTVGMKFVSAGTAACMADIITFPLDTAKVRLQIQGEGTRLGKLSIAALSEQRAQFQYRGVYGTLVTIVKQEGARGMYNGLVAGLQRQACFASVRIGLYDSVKQKYTDFAGGKTNVLVRIAAGITTGGCAVVLAQPTDVVKVRMQAQNNSDKKVVRYTGTIQAYKKIFTEEGLRGLWKGTIPNITRNAVVNASELVAYDMIKEQILKRRLLEDQFPCHFVSAFGAGFVTTCVASPVDVVKTRFMNSGKGKYKGVLDCAFSMFKEGGPIAFYKGFMPNFIRLGSWNICMFVFYEQLKRFCVLMKERRQN
ncbi:mitochondrial uncoupling protein 2-like [Anneissia japonica]|uniref:mitochondrial uncoupling protein 2-like n=1 Tax=Anneissia japonica TaxID=1529436 RepID=UPI001425558C|nr:mitochondrial uncoupling protein 2-like [Anneissia japonica]XP_033107802.1 mitochondrial uncoupling protein 2-like [Anneissia japonica]